MKFIVALLAVLAVGYVSATPSPITSMADVDASLIVSVTGISNAVSDITDTFGQLTPTTQAQLVNIVNSAWTRILQEINNLPELCNLTDDAGLISVLLQLLGLADDLGDKVGNIIGIVKGAIGQVKSLLPGSAAVIDVAFNSLLCHAQALVTTGIAGVNLIINGTIIYDVLNFKAVIVAGQGIIQLLIASLKSGPLGSVLGAILDQIGTAIDGIFQQVLCLADKMATKGISGLRNILTHLQAIVVAFTKLLLVCPII